MSATVDPELRRLLEALDVAPQPADDLGARLGIDAARVQELLADGAEKGLVTFWDPEYATTWRAKRVLHPGWFRRAVPGSAAVGLAVTALALYLGPAPSFGSHALAGLSAAGALVLAIVSARARPTVAGPSPP